MSVQERLPEERASFTDVFSAALRGRPCHVLGLGHPQELPVQHWRHDANAEDLALLSWCRGHTVDLGCGPGRLTAALAGLGHVVLGVDVVREALRWRGGPETRFGLSAHVMLASLGATRIVAAAGAGGIAVTYWCFRRARFSTHEAFVRAVTLIYDEARSQYGRDLLGLAGL